MEPITERRTPITKQATNPLTRVPHPRDDDSTTCKSKRQLLHRQIDFSLLTARATCLPGLQIPVLHPRHHFRLKRVSICPSFAEIINNWQQNSTEIK